MPQFPPDAHLKGGQAAAPVNAELARQFYAGILPVVVELHGQGLSLRGIAVELDRRGIRPRLGYDGQRWSATQVRRLLSRAAGEGAATTLVYGTRKTGKTPEAPAPQSQPLPVEAGHSPRACPANAQARAEASDRPQGGPNPLRWERRPECPRLVLLMAGSDILGGYAPASGRYRPVVEGAWGDPQPIPAEAPPLPTDLQGSVAATEVV
jgi:hypothetical protein